MCQLTGPPRSPRPPRTVGFPPSTSKGNIFSKCPSSICFQFPPKCPIKGVHLYPLTELFAWPYLWWIHGVVALVVRISCTHLLAIVCGLGELRSSAATSVSEDTLAWRGMFSGDATDLSPLTCDQIPHCLPHMGSNNLSGTKLRHFFYFVITALGLPWARLRIALGRLQHLQGFGPDTTARGRREQLYTVRYANRCKKSLTMPLKKKKSIFLICYCQCFKGVVLPKLKLHPFAAHLLVGVCSCGIFSSTQQFQSFREFHPVDAYGSHELQCKKQKQKSKQTNKKLQQEKI